MSATKNYLMTLAEKGKVCGICFNSEHTSEEHVEQQHAEAYPEMV